MGFEEFTKQKRKLESNFGAPGMQTEEQRQEWQQQFGKMQYDMEQAQRERGLTSGGEIGFGAESMDMLLSETTFAERTEYYFKTEGLLSAKEERYRKMSDDTDGAVGQFAEEHKNRSAKKRKKSAKKAAESFKKARDLEDAASGKEMSALDTYKSRDAIMRARMDGMIEAAKVKAKSADDEGYRVAKAKLKCLTILHDQLVNLQTDEQRKDFAKAKKDLLKELNSAQKEMAKYSQKQADEKWRAENGMDDPQVIEEIRKNCGNETATAEDVKVLLPVMTTSKELLRPEYMEAFEKCKENDVYKDMESGDFNRIIMHPCYYVRRDKNGKPINKTEQKKAEWNQRWLEAVSDKSKSGERTALLEEAYTRYAKMELPDLNEVKKKGAISVYQKDPVGIYSMCKFVLTIDNMRKREPFVAGFEKSHKDFKTKMDAWANFASILQRELGHTHLMAQTSVWEISKINKDRLKSEDEKAEDEEEYQGQRAGFIQIAEKSYADAARAKETAKVENTMNDKTLKIDTESEFLVGKKSVPKAYAKYSKESYRLYRDIAYGDQYIKNPLYLGFFDDKVVFRGEEVFELTRAAGFVLRDVKFDDNWQPMSEEDKKNHEWNMKYCVNINSMVKQELEKEKKKKAGEDVPEGKPYEQDVITEMAKEEFIRYYNEGFKLPAPEEIKKELIDKVQNKESLKSDLFESYLKSPAELNVYLRKCLIISNICNYSPGMKEFLKQEENRKIESYYSAGREFMNFLNAYTGLNYGVSFTEKKLDTGGMSDNLDFLNFIMERYTEEYNKSKG